MVWCLTEQDVEEHITYSGEIIKRYLVDERQGAIIALQILTDKLPKPLSEVIQSIRLDFSRASQRIKLKSRVYNECWYIFLCRV